MILHSAHHKAVGAFDIGSRPIWSPCPTPATHSVLPFVGTLPGASRLRLQALSILLAKQAALQHYKTVLVKPCSIGRLSQ